MLLLDVWSPSTDAFYLTICFFDAADGARTDLLRWHSQSTDGMVQLPVYVDEWLNPSISASIEQVVVHVHGKGG